MHAWTGTPVPLLARSRDAVVVLQRPCFHRDKSLAWVLESAVSGSLIKSAPVATKQERRPSALGLSWPGLGGWPGGDFEGDQAVGRGEGRLGSGLERFEVEVVALGGRAEGLGDALLGVEELELDRAPSSERDDRAGMDLVAGVSGGDVGEGDRDCVGVAVEIGSHVSSEERPCHKLRVVPGDEHKDRATVRGDAGQPMVPAFIELAIRWGPDDGLDVLEDDAVEPHLVLGVAAEAHLDRAMMPDRAVNTPLAMVREAVGPGAPGVGARAPLRKEESCQG